MKKLQRGLSMLGKKSVLERSILKASWNDDYAPPKTKYIQNCISALNSKGSIDSFALLVQYIKQITPTRWVYSCKILYIAHISIASSDTCYDLSDYLLHDDSEFTKVKSTLKTVVTIQSKDTQIIQYQTTRLVHSYWKYIFIIAKYSRSLYSHRYSNEGEEEGDDIIVIKDKSNNDDDKLNNYNQQDLENSLKTAENILGIGDFLTKLLESSISNLITLNMFEKYPFLKLITATLLSDLSLIYSQCKTFWQIHEKYFFKGVLLEGLFAFYEGLVKLTKRAKKIEFLRNHCRPCQILRLPIDYLQIVFEKNQKIELFYMQEKKGQGRQGQGQDQERRKDRSDQMEEDKDNGKEIEEKERQNGIESIERVGKDDVNEERRKRQEEEQQKNKINEGNNKSDHKDEIVKDKDNITQPSEKHKDTNENTHEAVCIVSLDSIDTQAKDEKRNNNNNRSDVISVVGVSLKQISERHKYQRHFRQNSATSTRAQPASVLEIPQENEDNNNNNNRQSIERQENELLQALQNQHSLNQHQLQEHYQQPLLDTHPLDRDSYETVPLSNNNNNYQPIHAIQTVSEPSSLYGLSNHFQHSNHQLNDQNLNSPEKQSIFNPTVCSNPPLSLHSTHPFQISFKKKRTKGSQELDAMQQQVNNGNQQESQDKQTNVEQYQVIAQHHGKVTEKSLFNQRENEYSKDSNIFEKHDSVAADINNDAPKKEYLSRKGQKKIEQKQQYFVYSSNTIRKLQQQEDNQEGEDDDYSMVDINTEENMSMCLNSDSPTSVGNKLVSSNSNGGDDQLKNNITHNSLSAIAAKSLITAAQVFQRAHSSVISQPNGNNTNTHQITDSFLESSSNEYYSQASRKKNKKTTFSKNFLTPQHKAPESIPTASIVNQQKSNNINSVGMFYV